MEIVSRVLRRTEGNAGHKNWTQEPRGMENTRTEENGGHKNRGEWRTQEPSLHREWRTQEPRGMEDTRTEGNGGHKNQVYIGEWRTQEPRGMEDASP